MIMSIHVLALACRCEALAMPRDALPAWQDTDVDSHEVVTVSSETDTSSAHLSCMMHSSSNLSCMTMGSAPALKGISVSSGVTMC